MDPETLPGTLRETAAVFERRGHPLTTSEVADRLDLGRRSAYARLERLAGVGAVETKKVGAGGRVWWRPAVDDGSAGDGADDEAGSAAGDGRPADRGREDGDGREREESRRLYRTLIEQFPNGVVAMVDRDLRYTAFGGSLEGYADLGRAELEGESLDRLPEEVAEVVVPRYVDALDGESSRFEATVGERTYRYQFHPIRDDDGDVFAALGMSQEITERVESERELEERIRQQRAVAAIGQRALECDDLDALFADAAALVAETLGNDYCKVLELDAAGEELLLREGVGWDEGVVGSATVSATEADSQAAYTLSTETPVVVDDLARETRFDGPDLLTDHDVRSGISTVIGSPEAPWGILGTHDTEPADVSEHDAAFVQSVANVLASTIERDRQRREVERRRRQLAAVNSVNRVVREITDAVIDRSTRSEIETAVCERFAASDSYRFAWIGDADGATREVVARAEAGVEGYLDDTTVSVDPDDEHGNGPTGRAYRTGEVQTTQHADEDPRQEPWADEVAEYGYRSSAAIPITHEGTVYGVLNVYTDRPRAFVGREREVIEQVGEVVGHAIAAVDRKRALLGDEVVELEFLVEDVLDDLGVDAPGDEPIELGHVIPVGDDRFLLYGTTTPAGVGTLEAMVETVPFYESVTVRSDGDDRRFELSVSEPPVLSVIASLGGAVEEAVIEDGDYRLTVCLSPSAPVRPVIDAVRETHPGASLLRRRQVTRAGRGEDPTASALASELSDRQRTALETATHAGYFAWPRDATAQEVAGTLGIAAPTFHQHLRKGQRKVFEALFADG
ncbi:bacterio-opsin activator domain-containing protein [Halobaculum sp. EA56]|uniref:bacterio-opsin activator domain-containing protein n=1 Tax=Halobaculum sp. EA56 TaxID=3421648 RepID=UPI003EBC3156